jgi:hypothetical protein
MFTDRGMCRYEYGYGKKYPQVTCVDHYTSDEFTKFLQSQGTECRLTTHNTSQHNNIAKLLNWCILEWVHAMPHHTGLPKNLWGKATLFAAWFKNWTSTKALGQVTPYE